MNLKTIMVKKGLSYKELGDLVGVTKQRISEIFNNEKKGISFATVEQFSTALGIKETDLVDPNFKNKLK